MEYLVDMTPETHIRIYNHIYQATLFSQKSSDFTHKTGNLCEENIKSDQTKTSWQQINWNQ